jgi:hypothetical protein
MLDPTRPEVTETGATVAEARRLIGKATAVWILIPCAEIGCSPDNVYALPVGKRTALNALKHRKDDDKISVTLYVSGTSLAGSLWIGALR